MQENNSGISLGRPVVEGEEIAACLKPKISTEDFSGLECPAAPNQMSPSWTVTGDQASL